MSVLPPRRPSLELYAKERNCIPVFSACAVLCQLRCGWPDTEDLFGWEWSECRQASCRTYLSGRCVSPRPVNVLPGLRQPAAFHFTALAYLIMLSFPGTEFVVVEDVSCFDTNAVILKGTTVLTYKPRFVDRPFSGSLFGIEVRSLCVDWNTKCLAQEKSIWRRILPPKLSFREIMNGIGGPLSSSLHFLLKSTRLF